MVEGEFGKFKDEESLVKGYENLEKEFTKKCQELGEIKKRVKDLGVDLGTIFNGENNEKGTTEETVILEPSEEVKGCECDNLDKTKINEVEAEKREKIEKEAEIVGKNPQINMENFKSEVAAFLEKEPDAKNYIKDISKILIKDKSLFNTDSPLKIAYMMAKSLASEFKSKQANKEDVNNEKVDEESTGGEKTVEKKSALVYPTFLGGGGSKFGFRTNKKYSSFEDARADLISRYFS